MQTEHIPLGTLLEQNERTIADDILRTLHQRHFLFQMSVDTTQLLGQWHKVPMGKKKGGLCQTNPEAAKKMIDHFGSFLGFLIRCYPHVAKDSSRQAHVNYEKHVLDFVIKQLDEELLAKVNEVSMVRLKVILR